MTVVTGLRGGVGASTLAAQIARVGHGTVIDLDSSGGGIDVLLGLEDVPGLRWPDLCEVPADLDGERVRAALPCWGAAAVLSIDRARSGPLEPQWAASVVTALRSAGPVVVDLPRAQRASPLGEAILRLPGVDEVWVAGQDVVSVAAGAALRTGTQGVSDGVSPRLVVRSSRGAELGMLEIADAIGATLSGIVATRRSIRHAVEWGCGPVDVPSWRERLLLRGGDAATLAHVGGGVPSGPGTVGAALLVGRLANQGGRMSIGRG